MTKYLRKSLAKAETPRSKDSKELKVAITAIWGSASADHAFMPHTNHKVNISATQLLLLVLCNSPIHFFFFYNLGYWFSSSVNQYNSEQCVYQIIFTVCT